MISTVHLSNPNGIYRMLVKEYHSLEQIVFASLGYPLVHLPNVPSVLHVESLLYVKLNLVIEYLFEFGSAWVLGTFITIPVRLFIVIGL